MTYCKHKPVFCECQPGEGVPCPHAAQDYDALIARLQGLADMIYQSNCGKSDLAAALAVKAADAIAALVRRVADLETAAKDRTP